MARHFKQPSIIHLSAIILLVSLAACAGRPAASPAPFPQPTRDPVLEQTIEKQLQALNPEALPVYRDATTAMDAGDWVKSKELYTQLTTMAPNFATAYRRLSSIELSNNNIDQAITLARKAVDLEPNAYNQISLADSLLAKNDPSNFQEAYDLASQAAKTLPDDELTITVWLVAASSNYDLEVIRQADERLLQINPQNPMAHYYAGALAANDGKWEKAEKELLIAQQLGLPKEDIQAILDMGISRNALLFRSFRGGAIALAAWFFGLGALFLSGNVLSKATLKAVDASQPSVSAPIKPQEHRMRSIYKRVITLLSLYYYISIPFVILLLLLVVGGLFYAFTLINTIPIYLAGVLIVMLIGSLIAILRSLFTKVKYLPPGRFLSRTDTPELWSLVDNVARKLGVRPVDAILLTPGVEIAVNERGSILKKIRDAGTRNLILGMGVLPGLTQGQLAAILAHEYGHFSHRDTAGGNLAHQVYASLEGMAQRLIESGSARFYNPVWLFVIAYQRIFLRVTLGASRLQEILADRYAAMAFGGTNCIEGLQSLIRQSIAFPMQADGEIEKAKGNDLPIVNLYDLPVRDDLSAEIGKEYDEAMRRTTMQYDSHPAPKERITRIEQLHIPYLPAEDNPRPVLELFPNPEELQREMTSEITRQLKQN